AIQRLRRLRAPKVGTERSSAPPGVCGAAHVLRLLHVSATVKAPVQAVHVQGRQRVTVGFEVAAPARVTGQCLRSEEHTSELQSRENLVCRLLLEKKNRNSKQTSTNRPPPRCCAR